LFRFNTTHKTSNRSFSVLVVATILTYFPFVALAINNPPHNFKRQTQSVLKKQTAITFTPQNTTSTRRNFSYNSIFALNPALSSFWAQNYVVLAKVSKIATIEGKETIQFISLQELTSVHMRSLAKPLQRDNMILSGDQKSRMMPLEPLTPNETVLLCQPIRQGTETPLVFGVPIKGEKAEEFLISLREISALRASGNWENGLYSSSELTTLYTLEYMTEHKIPANKVNEMVQQYVTSIRDLEANTMTLRIVANRWLAQGNQNVQINWAKQVLKNAKGIPYIELYKTAGVLTSTPEIKRSGNQYLMQLLDDPSVGYETKVACLFTLRHSSLLNSRNPSNTDSEQITQTFAKMARSTDPSMRRKGTSMLMSFYIGITGVTDDKFDAVRTGKLKAEFIQKYRKYIEEQGQQTSDEYEKAEIMNFLSNL
jgi:hypothetical protein